MERARQRRSERRCRGNLVMLRVFILREENTLQSFLRGYCFDDKFGLALDARLMEVSCISDG